METMTPRKLANRIKKELAMVADHNSQKEVKRITISIEWKRSRTWGSCPRATAEVSFKDGTFERREGYYASGCGYDKESTVIAEIFNDFLRYKLYQKRAWKDRLNGEDTNSPYGVYYYGGEVGEKHESGYISKPSYNGGVGTSCYTKISEFIGGQFLHTASGKTFDVYTYTDGK